MLKAFKLFKKLISIIALMLITGTVRAESKASIVYCSIGSEIHSIFGHVGLRIQTQRGDLVYNLGTFDANTPLFLQKYIIGNLDYYLSVEPYQNFVESYSLEGRRIDEYQILISGQDVCKLESKLIGLYYSSERAYTYEFLKNNCSTKVYSLINKISDKKLVFESSNTNITYRQMLNNILRRNTWARLPINILLGSIGEKVTLVEERSFLPDSLITQLINAKAVLSSGNLTEENNGKTASSTGQVYIISGYYDYYSFLF